MHTPIPGRECGTCNVCCEEPTINVPELKKPPGILCPHCRAGEGCLIHQRRPQVCRDFFCGWRCNAGLDEDWRPDRSDILIEQIGRNMPEGFEHAPFHYKFTLLGAPDKIYWPPLVQYISALVGQNVPVMLAVIGRPGYVAGQVLVNEALRPHVAAHSIGGTASTLARLLQLCIDHPQAKVDP